MLTYIRHKLLANKTFIGMLLQAQRIVWKCKVPFYRARRERLRREIFGRDTAVNPVRVLFFVTNMALWKYHEFFTLLNRSERFAPLIVPYFTPKTDVAIMRRSRDEIQAYAQANGFPYRDGYDFLTGTYDDLRDLHPDIVIYSQPYNYGHKAWGIDAFKRNALFAYTPYGAAVAEGRQFRDTYLLNIAAYIFVSSPIEKEVYVKSMPVNSEALIITGSEIFDLIKNADPDKSPWPDNGKKRIIWAPHHSIDDHNSFASSHFERLADAMLDIAGRYKDTVEFAFKPHPVLRTRLYEKWGKERTDAYYAAWNSGGNTFLATGTYTELFAFSDAMIHDCSSFAAEYLYTGHPVLYITESDEPGVALGNDYGRMCFNLHYHGFTTDSIEQFIYQTVIGGYDRLKPARGFFIDMQLTPPGSRSPGENMFRAMK